MDLELLPGLNRFYLLPDVPGEDSPLARVDALAARQSPGLRRSTFVWLRPSTERQAAYRLRYQAVIERGWLQPADLPEGREHDEYDDQAVHILAWDGETPVATCRLVLPARGHGSCRLKPPSTSR